MNIVFNGMISNLGNNGGTKTILKSAEILRNLGHKVEIAAHIDNFDWFKHKQPINFIPQDTDVVINIAAVDYSITRACNVPTKTAWWRGHESWSMSEDKLVACYRDDVVENIVNSCGLQNKLKSFGAESVVVYQGIDLDKWKYVGGRSYDRIKIGCLYQKKPTKRWKDFVKLAKILGSKDYEYVGFGDMMRNDEFLCDFKSNPSINELIDFYSSCHIFFAPSELDGLANPSMEAALCGCLIVCGDEPMGGMIYDYAFSDNTAMVYERKNIERAAELIQNPNWDLIENMQRHLRDNIGSREKNMKRLIKYLGEIK